MSRRKAPRRKVIEVWKTGAYGAVTWHHLLECGHIEQRKRMAPASHVGCETCFAPAPQPTGHSEVDPMTLAGLVRDRLTADIARHFDIPPEYVEVIVDFETGQVSFATVMFHRTHLQGLGLVR